MVIYGTALLAFCHLAGLFLGDLLGSMIGVKSNVGGVGIAMLMLISLRIYLHKRGLLPKETEAGVGFCDPALQVLLPREGSFTHEYDLSIRAAELTLQGVIRHKQVTVSNADRYAYASCKDERLGRFLQDQFIHPPGAGPAR